MLYVFHVDTGNMMTLDMSLTTESVQTLKEYVEEVFKIPADSQVLLISGGECLDSTKRVCSYSAGTDTNPIYLFSRSLHEATYLQSTVLDFREEDLLEKEKRYSELLPSFQTVSKRAQLAQQFSESAVSLLRKCEGLVSDQHNQHQGWAAVIANFEDVLVEFKCQFTNLECDFNEFLEKREYFVQFLKNFRENIYKLQKIPIIPKLLSKSDDKLKYLMETSEIASDNKELTTTSLYDWIGKDGYGNDLEMIYERCVDELNSLSRDQFSLLTKEVMDILISAEQSDMREIRGLGQRLFGLDKLIQDAKKKVQEQTELATSVNQNQSRVQNLKDSSILPDLCDTHIKQLSVMAENHKVLTSSRQICIRAKTELNINLNKRLEWVMHAQNNLQRIGDQIEVFSENIANLRYQLGILEQIDTAPVAYLSFVFEIVRRRSFSQAFLVWASELACRLLTIHSEEVARRKDFQSKFEDHFIHQLFPGIDDLPPGYGIQAPSHFDTVLPKLTEEDIEFLKKELPEMEEYLKDSAIIASIEPPYFLQFKSLMNAEEEKIDDQTSGELMLKEDQVELSDNLEKMMRDGVKESSLIHCLPHLKDIDKGCESETDTEEFEKVGQSPLDLNFDKDLSSPRRSGTQDASTLTEVGEKSPVPPKKPPRTFQKVPSIQTSSVEDRAMSISQSNTESFTNIKNPSLESIDELSSLKNFSSNTDSCFHSHYQQQVHCLRSKSISPNTPLSPKESPKSPLVNQPTDFVNDEFYIDESLPSSLSIENGHSQGEFGKQLDTANNVVALLQGNLEVSKIEYDQLKSLLVGVANLAAQNILQLKSELADFKNRYSSDKRTFSDHVNNLEKSFSSLHAAQKREEIALIQRMTNDHSNEINDFRKLAQVKNEEIKNLRTNNSFLESKVKKMTDDWNKLKEHSDENDERVLELQKKISSLEFEKEKSIKEITERLNREHKNEIKTLQARFKLMTMERTPSESSLEKNMEFSSLTNHESIINQITENFELEKEKAVKETLAKETAKWEGVIKKLWEEFEVQKKVLMETTISKIAEEKDKEIEMLRDREINLLKQVETCSSTIEKLTNSDISGQNIALMNQIEILTEEKTVLNLKLDKIQTDFDNMSSSVIVRPSTTTDSATSPIKRNSNLTRSFSSSSDKTNKCRPPNLKTGDQVCIVWDEEHESFRMVHNSPVFYFLHHDSFPMLGLKIIDGSPKKPNKLYCLGIFEEFEYCQARKACNRFKVPEGTKFYRVKVKPIESEQTIPRKLSTPDSTMNDSEFHSLPSSPKIRLIKIPEGEELSEKKHEGCEYRNSPTNADDSLFKTAIFQFSDDNNGGHTPQFPLDDTK